MCGKILAGFFILVAIAMAVTATVIKPDYVDYVIAVSRFFDIMLPVLAVGALIKYICTCKSHCDKKDN